MTATGKALDAVHELNASDVAPTWRVYLIHRDTFHWTGDYRSTLCGIPFNSRSYTEPTSVGPRDRVCPTCRQAAR